MLDQITQAILSNLIPLLVGAAFAAVPLGLALLKQAAKKTATKLDDQAIEQLEKAISNKLKD